MFGEVGPVQNLLIWVRMALWWYITRQTQEIDLDINLHCFRTCPRIVPSALFMMVLYSFVFKAEAQASFYLKMKVAHSPRKYQTNHHLFAKRNLMGATAEAQGLRENNTWTHSNYLLPNQSLMVNGSCLMARGSWLAHQAFWEGWVGWRHWARGWANPSHERWTINHSIAPFKDQLLCEN